MKNIATIFVICLFLIGCIKDTPMRNIEYYYSFNELQTVNVKSNSNIDFIYGYDDLKVNLKNYITYEFLKNQSESINIPQEVISYYVNDVSQDSSVVNFKNIGTYNIKISVGNKFSNELVVRVLDPKKIELKIIVDEVQRNAFVADGSKILGLNYQAFYNGEATVFPTGFRLFINDQIQNENLPKEFKTTLPNRYSLKVKKYDVESNEIIIDGKSPIKELKLETSFVNGTIDNFLNDGESRCLFKINAFDEKNNPYNLTNDIQFLLNNKPIDIFNGTFNFTTKKEGTYNFIAKGYNIESKSITIIVKSPDIYPTIRLPIIFHYVNTTIPVPIEGTLQQVINDLNLYFRNDYAKLNNAPTSEASADIFIEYYLADVDLQGRKLNTKGLDIVNGFPKTPTFNDLQEDDLKKIYWNPKKYINVYIFDFPKSGFAGLAYLPPIDYNNGDFLFRLYGGGNTTNNYAAYLNNTLNSGVVAHELGHMLGLQHAFGNSENCSKNIPDDYCEDTPDYDYSEYLKKQQDLKYSRISCKGKTFTSTNIMDYNYSYDTNFTRDQRKIMRFVLKESFHLPTPKNANNNQSLRSNLKVMPKSPPIICF